MYYIIYALDRPDAGDLRIKTRAAHREYLHRPDLPVRLVLARPLLADDAVTLIGSVIVVAADRRSQVEAFSAAERKSGGSGKSVSVHVELGGRRIITNSRNTKINYSNDRRRRSRALE